METLQPSHQQVLSPGQLTYMYDAMGYHALENISEGRAMTLHIYVSPLDVCEVYDEEVKAYLRKKI